MIHVVSHQAEIMKYIFELDKTNSNCDHVSALLQILKKSSFWKWRWYMSLREFFNVWHNIKYGTWSKGSSGCKILK